MWICVTCTVQFLECVQILLSIVMGTVYSYRKFVWSQNFNRLASHLPFLKVLKILYTTKSQDGNRQAETA